MWEGGIWNLEGICKCRLEIEGEKSISKSVEVRRCMLKEKHFVGCDYCSAYRCLLGMRTTLTVLIYGAYAKDLTEIAWISGSRVGSIMWIWKKFYRCVSCTQTGEKNRDRGGIIRKESWDVSQNLDRTGFWRMLNNSLKSLDSEWRELYRPLCIAYILLYWHVSFLYFILLLFLSFIKSALLPSILPSFNKHILSTYHGLDTDVWLWV